MTDSVCKWMSPQCTIDCFADISTREVCTVTPPQKLDLDQMSERNTIRILKDTNNCSLSVENFGFIRFASYDPVWAILISNSL